MMNDLLEKYEAVIGLEVHAQLLTKRKAFAPEGADYGESPNTQISPVTLGHPGTLPFMNKKVIELAVKMGLACNCSIRHENHFSRKNYFYPDLPKGYQITQHNTPICYDGFLKIKVEGVEKRIGITRIHMEEDAGKSIHDQDPYFTLVDLNRAGTPLIEIVSEPDLRSSDDAYSYLTEIRKIVRYLDICDGNMEEGSLRCDANISVRIRGAEKFGAKVEVKNMNSIRNVKRAIEFEIKRQIEAVERGEKIPQETRGFDAATGTTSSQRTKEESNDYRYFPEPDLPPVNLTDDFISAIRSAMPALPEELKKKWMTELALTDYDASLLTEDKSTARFFEKIIQHTKNFKAAANWMMGPVRSWTNENGAALSDFPISPETIALLIQLIDAGKISHSSAEQKLFSELLKNPTAVPSELAAKMNLLQESDEGSIATMIDEVLSKYPDKVSEFRNGKSGVAGLFMGELMKLSKGKADPKLANRILLEKLKG